MLARIMQLSVYKGAVKWEQAPPSCVCKKTELRQQTCGAAGFTQKVLTRIRPGRPSPRAPWPPAS